MIAQETQLVDEMVTEDQITELLRYKHEVLDSIALERQLGNQYEDRSVIDLIVIPEDGFEDRVAAMVDAQHIFTTKLTSKEKTVFAAVTIDGLTRREAGAIVGISQMHATRQVASVINKIDPSLAPPKIQERTSKTKIINYLASLHEGREADPAELNSRLAGILPNARYREMLITMYLEGLTNRQVAERFGGSHGPINHIISKVANALSQDSEMKKASDS